MKLPERLERWSLAALAAGGLVTIAVMVWCAQPWRKESQLNQDTFMFFAWGLLPYLVMGWLVLSYRRTQFEKRLSFFAGVLIVLFGMYCLVGLFIAPDANGALIFVFAPFYQLGAAGLTICIVLGLRMANRVIELARRR